MKNFNYFILQTVSLLLVCSAHAKNIDPVDTRMLAQPAISASHIAFVYAEDIWIANLIGQHKIKKDENGNAPIRYEAVKVGLDQVGQFAVDKNATIHMPRIGCGLAGGTWDKIEPLIKSTLVSKKVSVTVYDF